MNAVTKAVTTSRSSAPSLAAPGGPVEAGAAAALGARKAEETRPGLCSEAGGCGAQRLGPREEARRRSEPATAASPPASAVTAAAGRRVRLCRRTTMAKCCGAAAAAALDKVVQGACSEEMPAGLEEGAEAA